MKAFRVTTEDIDALAYAIEATGDAGGDRTHFETVKVLEWLAKNEPDAHKRLSQHDYLEQALWFV